MGRAGEALTNHFLPFLRAMQARGLSEQTSSGFDVDHLYLAHWCVGEAYFALHDLDKALFHRQEGLRIMRSLMERAPDAAEFVCALPVRLAEVGEALLALDRAEGALRLQEGNETARTPSVARR